MKLENKARRLKIEKLEERIAPCGDFGHLVVSAAMRSLSEGTNLGQDIVVEEATSAPNAWSDGIHDAQDFACG